MAINPSDTTYAIVKETVAGTTPATPTFSGVDYIPGTMPMFQSDNVTSTVQKANRGSAGSRKTNFSVGGGLSMELCRDAAIEALMESALSGTWVSNVLKASNVDPSFTIEEKKIDGSSNFYQRFTGVQVSSMNIACSIDSIASLGFEFVGMNRTTATTAIASAIYNPPSTKLKLAGLEVTNVSVGSLSGLIFTDLNLTVSQSRETLGQFGSSAARGVGTSGIRTATLELTCYRNDFGIETALLASDTPVAVSFTIGANTGGVGYTFTLPAAYVSVPQNSIDGAKDLVTMTFTGSFDNTAGTDIQITRLP